MKVTYENDEHQDDPDNGGDFSSISDVLRLLDEQPPYRRRPFSFHLINERGLWLTVGIERKFGFVQHEEDEGGPYFLALDRATAQVSTSNMEFMVGGTPTPIPGRFRVSVDKLKRIVQEWLTTGARSNEVEWEIVGAQFWAG